MRAHTHTHAHTQRSRDPLSDLHAWLRSSSQNHGRDHGSRVQGPAGPQPAQLLPDLQSKLIHAGNGGFSSRLQVVPPCLFERRLQGGGGGGAPRSCFTVSCLQLALPYLRQSKGNIINVSSLVGTIGQRHAAPYVATKVSPPSSKTNTSPWFNLHHYFLFPVGLTDNQPPSPD